ncbi:IS66 family insertion sequence element accessory protein TnpA [Orrella sp. 11846]|uniref:IS66 family insertion sequence element accessory protein TnpA n=1 Tax=Orrella sp. 11846 TaxID=3409913 RepID=UPI003B5BEC64
MSIKKPQTPHVRSYDEWCTLVHQYEAENTTIKAFCQQRKIAYSTFCKWLSKLRKSSVISQPSQSNAVQSEVPPKSSDFLDIGAINLNQSSSLELRLDLGDGVVLTLLRR